MIIIPVLTSLKSPLILKSLCGYLKIEPCILTKDNAIKRKWVGDPTCCFCPHLKQMIICSSLSLLLKWYEDELLNVFILDTSLEICNNNV
jgi:hypothetical protein